MTLKIVFVITVMILFLKIACTDWKTKKISNRDIFLVFLAGAASMWFSVGITLFQRVSGSLVISVPLFLLALVIPGSIGGGDIKLMAAGGFLLGNTGICNAFCIGILLSGIYVICLLINKKADRKTVVALGPFLCAGMNAMLIFTYINPAF